MREITFKNLAGIILIPARINGTEGWVAFDTGAMQTALNKNYFFELGGKTTEVAKFDGELATTGAMETHLREFSLDGITINDLPVLLMDMAYVENSLKTIEPELRFLGSAGIEIVGKAPVLVDYERSRVTLDPDIDTNDTERLPLSMEALPVITLDLAGEPHRFVLDTGANTCLLSGELSGKIETSPVPNSPGVCTIPLIRAGGREYVDVTAAFTDLSHIQKRVDVDGVIGYQILSKQLSLLDFPNGAVYLFDSFR